MFWINVMHILSYSSIATIFSIDVTGTFAQNTFLLLSIGAASIAMNCETIFSGNKSFLEKHPISISVDVTVGT